MKLIRYGKYAFVLSDSIDGKEKIVGECCVRPVKSHGCCLPHPLTEYFLISDVLIHSEYRRQGYGVALMLNVMNWLENYYDRSLIFRTWVSRYNIPALHFFNAVFGPPYTMTAVTAYFSNTPVARRHRPLF
jgi:GNAT superfamily N-acetyltransferase